MDFTTAVKIIMRDLEETREIIDDIAAASEVHAAELELAKARLHSATETLSLLPRMAQLTITVPPQPSQPVESKTEIPPVVTIESEKRQPEETSVSTAEPAEQVLEIEDEIIPPVEIGLTDKTDPTESKTDQEPASRAIFADKFSSEGVLGDNIVTSKSESDLAASIISKPITDITSAIGINDRFYFIRELFGNNSEEYSKALSRLNKAISLGDAINILDKSVVSRPDTEAYSAFTDILKRKFTTK